MEEKKKKEIQEKKANKYSTFSLVYDEFAILEVVNAIQESYAQSGISARKETKEREEKK